MMLKRLLYTVDKWGPLTVSVIALSLLLVIGWWYSERIARLEGKVSILEHQELQKEVNAIKNWMIAVYERGEAKGWDLPDRPDVSVKQKDSKKKEKKK